MNKTQLFALSAILATSLGSLASAQAPTYTYLDGPERIMWPTSAFGTPSFGRTLAADITGDGLMDAFVLTGTQPICLFGISRYTSLSQLPRQANDMAISRKSSPTQMTSLAVVNSTGLEIIYYVNSPSPGFQASTIVGGSWTGAKLIRCADLNGSTYDDYVGVGSDQRSILQKIDGQGSIPVWSSPRNVIDMALLNWDTTTSDYQVALLTTGGVDVYRLDGTLLNSFVNEGTAGDAITVVNGSKLAWIYTRGSAQKLKLLSSSGAEPAITLPSMGFVSLAAADANGDGFQDLMISNHSTFQPMFLQSNTSSPFFTAPVTPATWQYVTIDPYLAAPATGNMASPLFKDLDGDGAPDLLLPLMPSSSQQPSIEFLTVAPGPTPSTAFVSACNLTALSGGLRTLNPGVFFSPPAGCNSLQVLLWKERYINGTLYQDVLLNDEFGIPIGTYVNGMTFPVVFSPTSDDCFNYTDGGASVQALYWIEVKPSHFNGTSFDQTFDDYIAAIAAKPDDICTLMTTGTNPGPWYTLVAGGAPSCGDVNQCISSVGSTPAPGIVIKHRIPGFEPNQPPHIPVAPTVITNVTAL